MQKKQQQLNLQTLDKKTRPGTPFEQSVGNMADLGVNWVDWYQTKLYESFKDIVINKYHVSTYDASIDNVETTMKVTPLKMHFM